MKYPLIHSLVLAVLVMVAAVSYAAYGVSKDISSYSVITPNTATSTSQMPESQVQPYGPVTLGLNEVATFKDVSIRPIEIVEESRCPANANCIQAGTVRIRLEIVSGMGTSSNILTLGNSITTEAETITFENVTPGTLVGKTIKPSEYQFTFSVVKRVVSTQPNTPQAPVKGKCYVGGCSAQICSDQPDMASTCEYRSEYACYANAKCERQASGSCGWTMTNELRMCLANPE